MHTVDADPSWFDPTHTVWLDQPSQQRKDAFAAVVASGVDYLDREVYAVIDSMGGSSPNFLWRSARLTTDEFPYIEEAGIKVPEVAWHVWRDRLIAHVAIIDGLSLETQRGSSRYEECDRLAEKYRVARWGYRKQIGVGARQCVYGSPRKSLEAPSDYYYVDIEPRLGL